MKTLKTKHLLMIGIIVLLLIPLLSTFGSEFEGADDQAANMVLELNPRYVTWVGPVWEPGSDLMENILFFLQATIGVALISAYFYFQAKKRQDKEV